MGIEIDIVFGWMGVLNFDTALYFCAANAENPTINLQARRDGASLVIFLTKLSVGNLK